ncbi:MAG: hypothetical protein ABS43_11220 [Bordetella sp. SCN 67-23]|nr:alpha/beta fold hydrolase [Burkholderiales bacterium]ODS74136.1 MAG: hypothetical protein ABS43_11220 [Bordetella sp. SCN 67-23]ODU96245.1 MAG: hypothetical protein ABT00_02430 [Bordetella sp. SCN 68-11]OJW87418.1 MAG: hypothetical protein BGO71_28930 [Burkholderiales bacterium 67-32]
MIRRLDIRGTVYAYEESGAGPLVLFGHGLYFDRAMFARQAEALADRFRCVRLDWPGHGDSGWRPQGWTVTDLVEDVAALIPALGAERAILVGLSQGGAVFTRTALAHPERVAALVVMNATPHAPASEARGRMEQACDTLAHGSPADREQLFRSIADRMFSPHARAVHPGRIAAARQVFARHDPAALALAVRLGLSYEDLVSALGDLAAPTLLLWGADDEISPLALARAYLGQTPDVRLVALPQAGHSAPLEQPEAVTRELAAFLDGLAPSEPFLQPPPSTEKQP